MRAAEFLFEMIVHTDTASPNKTIIAYNKNIWLFDTENGDMSVASGVVPQIRKVTGLTVPKGISDIHDWLVYITDTRPDILVGTIHNGILYTNPIIGHYSGSSPLVKKVVSQLGISKVVVNQMAPDGEEYNATFSPQQLQGRISDIVYHGTCTKFISSILQAGIRSTENMNWKNVGKFAGKIFLTADMYTAKFHANRQAVAYHCAPVVVATKIPDLTKVTMDFDVAAFFYGTSKTVTDTDYRAAIKKSIPTVMKRATGVIRKYNPKTDFTRSSGIFAYQGRIPPGSFVGIFSTLNNETEMGQDNFFTFKSAADFLTAYDIYQDFGYYDPQLAEENDFED